MTVDPNLLSKIIAKTEKDYGTSFFPGSQKPNPLRIPFESPELNLATGGGIPIGSITRIWGEESTGKSANLLLLAKHAQNIHVYAQQLLEVDDDRVKARGEELLERFPEGMTVCLYDLERSFDDDFARRLGVDTEKLLILDDRRIEIVGETVEATLPAANLHLIDSTAAGVSIDELKEKISKWQVGLKPRVWNKVVDRFQAAIDKRHNAIVFADQVRVDNRTGSYYAPGGKKLAHEASLVVQLRRGSWLYRTNSGWNTEMPMKGVDTVSETAEAEGMEIKAFVNKNRTGQAHRRALYRYDMKNRKVDLGFEFSKIAKWAGLVTQSGSWYELKDGKKVQGTNGLTKEIEENLELKKQILDYIEVYCVSNP